MPVGRSLLAVGLLLGSAAVLFALLAPPAPPAAPPVAPTEPVAANAQPPVLPKFDLQKGDHICIIGNTLADRMQHDGWVETFLYARRPNHDLVIRNLGYSGDEINLRLRSED